MKKYKPLYVTACVVAVLVIVGWWLVSTADFTLFSPAGEVAKRQRNILLFALSMSAIVVIPVFTLYGIFAWRYRENGTSKKRKYTPEWSSNKWLEIVWWGIPILIISIMAATAWITAHSLDPYRPLKSANKTVQVQVVALEWKWLFLYPEQKVATINHLVIPEKTPIHFTIGADAPMSAFWIPTLGSQIYAMNGMSAQLNLMADRTGSFKGYNTNISGHGYSDMEFNVDSVSARDFADWVRDSSQRQDELTQMTFDNLVKPNIMKSQTYSFTDTSLYDRIVEKYMPSDMMSSGNYDESSGASNGSGTQNANMKAMEGM